MRGALFMVFQLDSKGAQGAKVCDLVKSFLTSIYYFTGSLFTCNIWRQYIRERASQSLPTISSQKLEKKLEQT